MVTAEDAPPPPPPPPPPDELPPLEDPPPDAAGTVAGVYRAGVRIGESATAIRPIEGGFLLEQKTVLALRVLGKDALVSDPAKAADQAVRMVMEQKVRTISGKVIDAKVETICIHGDSPGADKIVAAVRDGLVKAGVIVKPLRDWLK